MGYTDFSEYTDFLFVTADTVAVLFCVVASSVVFFRSIYKTIYGFGDAAVYVDVVAV